MPKQERVCKFGHHYFKSSDCPVCPICEQQNKPENSFLGEISAPARRALQREGISSLIQLSAYSESHIIGLHGVGPSVILKLKDLLKAQQLTFKN